MSATIFTNGSYLNPAFMNTIFGLSGHKHDGVDADGSAPQVDLAAHVFGILPLGNMNMSRGSWDAHFVGGEFSGSPDLTIDYLKFDIVSTTYHWIYIYSDGVTGTAGSTATMSKGSVVTFAPSTTLRIPVTTYNNGVLVPGIFTIDGSGNIAVQWYKYSDGTYNTNFATSNTKGINSFSSTYVSIY